MKSNKPQVILILMFVLLFLIVLSIVLNLKKEKQKTFRAPTQRAQSQDLFENTYDFVDYAKNSDKLLDMFKSLEEAEKNVKA